MATRTPLSDWPALRTYTGDQLRRIALPLGGIGTGTVSLGGRGDLRDWEIMNRPAKGHTPDRAFFAVWARPEDKAAVTRCLEGAVAPEDHEGGFGCGVPNHGLPRFADCTFETAYPCARIAFSDPQVPVRVTLEAFNPFIPTDADASGHPIAMLRYVLTNPTKQPLSAAVCGTVPNLVGADGTFGAPHKNTNRFRKGGGLQGLFMSTEGMAAECPQWGTMALSTDSDGEVTYREAWHAESWGTDLLAFWDDFSADGKLDRGKRSYGDG